MWPADRTTFPRPCLLSYLDIIEPDIRVPGGDEEELRGVGPELDGRDAVLWTVLQQKLAAAFRHLTTGG